jgi:hypothetical protein
MAKKTRKNVMTAGAPEGAGPESCTELNVGPHTCNLVSNNEGRIHKSSFRISIYLTAVLESPI